MAAQPQARTATERETVADNIEKVRELYADAPEVGRIGLEKMMAELQDRRGRRAAESRERRPHRAPSGQGVGADRYHKIRTGRS